MKRSNRSRERATALTSAGEYGPFSRTQATSSSRVCDSWKQRFESDANLRAFLVRRTVWRCTGIPPTTSVPFG